MFFVRQGATHKIVIGPVVAVGDGFTPVTNLSVATADEAEAILHDNGTVVDISGYTFAAITTADGYYHLTLQSGISGTVGHVTVIINDDSLCLPLKAEFTVVEEAIYDAVFAASANAWTGAAGASKGTGVVTVDTTTTNTDMRGTDSAALASVCTEGRLAELDAGNLPATTDAILVDTAEIGAAGAGLTDLGGMSTTMKAQVEAEVDDALTAFGAATAAALVTAQADLDIITGADGVVIATGTQTFDMTGNVTGNLSGSVGSVSGAVGSVTGAVGSVTGAVGSVAGDVVGSVGSLATQAKADVEAEANDALVALHLDHLLAAGYDPAAKPGAADALLNEVIENDGGVSRFTANALEQAPGGSAPTVEDIDAELSANHGAGSWESGGLGTGARTVTITVDDGTDPLESARVRMQKGAENYVGSTDASGVIVFSLDDGTWDVAVSLAGYQFTPTTTVVNGTEAVTLSMTALTITPSEPGQTTGYLVCYDEDGVVEVGTSVSMAARKPGSSTGLGLDDTTRTVLSDANGLVEFANLFKGERYSIWRGTDSSKAIEVTIPAAAGATYELPSVAGRP